MFFWNVSWPELFQLDIVFSPITWHFLKFDWDFLLQNKIIVQWVEKNIQQENMTT